MNVKQRVWKKFLVAGAALALVTGIGSTLPTAYAGGTIKADETKWISIGIGLRTHFSAQENASPSAKAYTNAFNVDNTRIYINGQIHKYIKFTVNTECFNCGANNGRFGGGNLFAGQSNIGLIDSIGKFEYSETVNMWVGRTLVPFDRGELNGPFYHPTYDGFKTPFLPNDQSANFGRSTAANDGAGLYGRDNGVVFFGRIHPMGTHFQYAFSVFQGQNGGPNQGSSLLYAGRFTWNLLADEHAGNPGYYTAGTYYGGYGDLVALAVGFAHQKDGVGSATTKDDLNAIVFDGLIEKVLPDDGGIITINGEFKRYWAQNRKSFTDGVLDGGTGLTTPCGCGSINTPTPGMWIMNGNSWTIYGLYLFPEKWKTGWGRLQPYGRFTRISPIDSSQREEWEAGVNYVIDGFNARASAYWQYGDIATKGFVGGPGVFAPGRTGDRVDSFHVALQLQY
jgi:hypothetical protein